MAENTLPASFDLPQETPTQLNLFNFELLSRARDMMAYRALGSIAAAICCCRQNRNHDAIAILATALNRYELADRELQAVKAHLEAREKPNAS